MHAETPQEPRGRVLDALDVLASEFGLPGQRAAVERAGDGWRDEVLAAVAECLAGLALDTRAGRPKARVRKGAGDGEG